MSKPDIILNENVESQTFVNPNEEPKKILNQNEKQNLEVPDEQNNMPDNQDIISDVKDEIVSDTLEKEEYNLDMEIPTGISLIQHLDRTKLVQIYEELYTRKRQQSRKSYLLNRKLFEYYRRQKNYAATAEENPNLLADMNKKYIHKLIELDSLIKKKQLAIEHKVHTIKPLKDEINLIHQKEAVYIETFEKRLKDIGPTLKSESSGEYLDEETVDTLFSRMSKMRSILNTERLSFIRQQDLTANIEKKASALENLGNGLRMIDFKQLQAETQSLSDKIEERDKILGKLRARYDADKQSYAGLHEKELSIKILIKKEKEILEKTNSNETSERLDVHRLKRARDNLRKNLNNASEGCGLLDKPTLLKDFDCTVKMITEINEEIAKLKKEIDELRTESRHLANVLSEGALEKTDSEKFDELLAQKLSDMDKPIFPFIKQGIKSTRKFDLNFFSNY